MKAKKLIKVYRYEFDSPDYQHPRGAYNARHIFWGEQYYKYIKLQKRMTAKHCNEKTHPSGRVDIEEVIVGEHYFACPSIESLKKWFKGFNKGLIALGFNLVEYSVTEMLMGESGKQCAFLHSDVKKKKIIE